MAAVNGPEQVVVSGDRDAIRAMREAFRRNGVATHALDVTRAFHSREIDPILDDLEAIAAKIGFQPPRVPVISNVSGRPAGLEIQTPAYWRNHAREPVRFQTGIEWLAATGLVVFVEIGPTATLSSLGRSCAPTDSAVWLPSLCGGSDEWSEVLDALGGLYVSGAGIDWRAFHARFQRRLISLPTYPFERSRHWIDAHELVQTSMHLHVEPAPRAAKLDPARWVPKSRWEIPAGRIASGAICDLAQIAANLAGDSIRSGTLSGENGDWRAHAGNGEDYRSQRDGHGQNRARGMADRFAAAHVQRAFREFGWSPAPGDRWTTVAPRSAARNQVKLQSSPGADARNAGGRRPAFPQWGRVASRSCRMG